MENLWTEYKRETPSYEKLHKKLSAFSNAEGGFLYIGIDDNGEFFATPKEKIEQLYEGLNSLSDNDLKAQINVLWKIEKHLWKKRKDQLVYKILVKVSEKPIATIIQNKKRYYVRVDSFIQESDFVSIMGTKEDLKSWNMELNTNICRGLINLKRKFAKREYRLLYNLINEKDKATTLGLYFSDLPPTDIKYRNENNQTQITKIVDIQDLLNNLNDDFEANKYYGVYYMPYVNAINKIKEISQELILNAIAHGDLSKEIKIEFKDDVFSVQFFFKFRAS